MDQHNFRGDFFFFLFIKNVFQQFQKLYCNLFLHFLGSIWKVTLYPFQDKGCTMEGLIDQSNPWRTEFCFSFCFLFILAIQFPAWTTVTSGRKRKGNKIPVAALLECTGPQMLNTL